MPKYLSGRSKVTPQSKLQSDRYRYLSIENAEPNLGDPLVGLSSVTAKPIPPGQQYIVVSVQGSAPGERYWIPNQGGIIPGSISVFDEGTLVGTLSSITQLNFVGVAITASVSIASSNLATIRVFSPGNNQEIIFNTANEFSTSTKLKFDPSIGLLTAGDRIIVGAGGTVITTTGVGSVGIGTTNPTQELHIQGDLRLTGTIYDSNNQPGTDTQLLVKNNFGGLTWINQGVVRAGAGGTYTNIQFHNNAGLVDGASNFVFDDVNSRVGIGSTQPKVLLDVLGISSFKGGTTIDNLNVTGVTTTQNFRVTGVSTVGFVTGTSAFFTGIVTATKFVGELNVSQLYVTGISTFLQKVNINSDLGVTGLTTTENLQVYQSTTLNRLNVTGVSTFTTVDVNGGEIDVTRIGTQNLNVSGIGTFNSQVNINNLRVTGVGTFDNIKIYDNNIETTIGNLILDSSAGTTQINDAVYVNDTTQSTSKDTGSIITEGGVGIEKDLYVGGPVNLATSGGITTTGGDLYVKGNLYVSNDIFYDELFARNGYFTGITSTKDLNVTGIATIATLGVTGLTTTRNLIVSGISTFNGLLDANAGATIDNIQIGISGDNEIDTSTGNLILDSAGGTTTLDDNVSITGNLTVSGISTFNSNVTLGDASTDTVTFTSRINSDILPSTNALTSVDVNGKDLGGTTNYWRKIYAREFDGQFIGNADSASQVSTGTTIGTTTYYPTFVDSNNPTRGNEFLYTDAGISYNPSTDLLAAGNLGVTGLTTTRNLRVIGVGTFDGLLDANSGATIDNIQIGISGDNEIDTSTGNLILDSFGGTVEITDQLIVSGISTFSNNAVFNGDVDLGNATSDTVTFTARVDSSILPSTNGTLDLGGPSNKWNNIYANNFVGAITGNADSASQVSTGTTTGTTTYYPTFVDSNNVIRGDEFLYTDADISYNPSTDLLAVGNLGVTGLTTTRNLIVSGISTFNGLLDANAGATIDNIQIGISGDNEIDTSTGNLILDSAGGTVEITDQLIVSGISTFSNNAVFNANVTIGDANTDKVSFGATVDSNIIPSGTTRDLGSVANKWNNIYANNFVGTITGNAETATKLATPREIDISGDVIGVGIGTTFDGSQNVTIPTVLSTTGVSSATYGSATTVPQIAVDAKGRITSASNVNIDFSKASYADNAGISTNLKGGAAYQIPYQSSANTTLFIPNGSTTGQLLQYNSGSAPSWVTATDLTVSKASYADNAGISTNLKGGIASQIPYQSAANTTTFIPNGTTGQLLQSNGTSAPSWVTTTDLTVSKASYADNAGISTNLKGGIASQIPYQSAANTTLFIPNGSTTGQLLQYNSGSAPSWVTATDLTVSRASYADNAGISTNLKGGIASQIPYQTAANTTAFIPNGTTGQLLQSNGTSAPSWVTATDLTVSRASYADNAGIATNLKGGAAGSIPYQSGADVTTFLADPNINGRILTWNDTTNAPIWSDPTAISVGTASSLSVTTDTSSSPRYLVLSSTTSGITTALVDSNITYTPSTDLLTVSKIKPTQIQDTGGGTGTANYVLTANGSGGWSWSSVTGGGSPAIAGITIQEEGSTVGTQLGITTVNFVGASVTATSPSAGTANISITAASNVTVTQTGYTGTNPISVTGGSNIGIGSTSNAYGTRYIQTFTPTTEGNDGDVWYQIT